MQKPIMRGRTSLMVVATLAAPVLVGCHGRSSHARRHAVGHEQATSGPALAEIDLSRGAAEAPVTGLLVAPTPTYYDLLKALRKVGHDARFKGVFVRFGDARTGWARGAEIARELGALRRAGKRVVCHAETLGNASFGLAAASCDRLWLSPAGDLETVGLSAEMVFARELLDRLGVAVDVLQVGKYKGTGETFTRDSASDEFKASLGGVLGDLRGLWREGIRASRLGRAIDAVEAGPYGAERSKELGLVDDVGYVDQAREQAAHDAGVEGSFLIYGGKHEAGEGGLVEVVRVLSGAKRGARGGGDGHVALVRASGAIVMERGGSVLGEKGGIVYKPLAKTLRELADDESTKAVVLRIDSPGGSALASDLLWHDLMRLRADKPLVVSVGDMAASGGYYMAAAANKIVAEDASIVGSIGVVGGKLAFGPALRPFGVHVDAVAADPSAPASRSAFSSPLTPWDDATRAQVLASMTSVYDLFVRRVAEGRHLPEAQVRSFAEGRIFSGRAGKERGMVDEIGGLERAIEIARAEAHLAASAPVSVVGDEPGLLAALGLDDDDDEVTASLATRAAGPLSDLVAAVPEVGPFAASVWPLARGEHALVAVPFAFLIR